MPITRHFLGHMYFCHHIENLRTSAPVRRTFPRNLNWSERKKLTLFRWVFALVLIYAQRECGNLFVREPCLLWAVWASHSRYNSVYIFTWVVFGFISGTLRWRDGFLSSRRLALALLHWHWLRCRKDHFRKNLRSSVYRYFAIVQFLHGSFRSLAFACYLCSRISYACSVCGGPWPNGWLYNRSNVHCYVRMYGPWQDVRSLGRSPYDSVLFNVTRCSSGRWEQNFELSIFSNFVVCNPCQSPASLTLYGLLLSLWCFSILVNYYF